MRRTMEKRTAVKNGVLRMTFAVISLLLEAGIILFGFTTMNAHAEWVSIGTKCVALILVIAIYSQDKTSTMKMPWIILIAVLPVFGTALYLMIGLNGATRKMRLRYEKIDQELLPLLVQKQEVLEHLEQKSPYLSNIARYLANYSGYPVYENTQVTYYEDATKALEAQKEALRSANKFIFLEYHAIEDAKAWQGIEAILEEKVRQGVEVRVFYDDMGSIWFVNTDFAKRLNAKGIQCRVFNPFFVGLNIFLNNRDHRKITVIDGRVAFTGGYNLANEYFNITHPYGYWKDTGVRVTGEAVRNFTIAFLEMWNAVRGTDKDDSEHLCYLPRFTPEMLTELQVQPHGFVQPYADTPLDKEQVGENVYISLAEGAKQYVWYVTPYLIITDEMIHALGLAAKRGVDVRIITPGIPDKKIVYSVTRSYYHALVRNGVKIYEYTPGFCHCKMCVCDDMAAVCGTINLDYRSLYHHFEDGCLYCDCPAVYDTKRDFENMMQVSVDVTEQYRTGRKAMLRFGQLVLRFLAPLL